MKMQNCLTSAVFFKKTCTASLQLGVCLAVSEVASEMYESLSSWNQNCY